MPVHGDPRAITAGGPKSRQISREEPLNPLRSICLDVQLVHQVGMHEETGSRGLVKPRFWQRHRWLKWLVGVTVIVSAVFFTVAVILAHRAEPILRATIVSELQDHFHARVELDSFHIALRNGLWADGKGLRIWPPVEVAGVGVPPATGKPLIQIGEFRFHTPLSYDPDRPIRISSVQLTGLDIDLPPKSHFEKNAHNDEVHPGEKRPARGLLAFQIANLECKGAHFSIESNKPGKAPLEFAIARFDLKGIGAGRSMAFEADLTNPRPVGTIHTKGNFGPWLVSDPGESPIQGNYTFENADLSTFRGIAGILNSTGRYDGTLRDIVAEGETDTPDFRLTRFGTKLPLHTAFHAVVDGTNGDTQLDPVRAVLGHSQFAVRGQVVRAADLAGNDYAKGHDITVTIFVDDGRIEDFLRLASHSGNPLLTGAFKMKGNLDIPPGTEPVDRRLKISGAFTLSDAKFTSAKIQNRIGDLSKRGLGLSKEAGITTGSDVRSEMSGNFEMTGGYVVLPQLHYTVPGAMIDLKGVYGVENGALDFAGTAKMQATVSQMVGGWKGFLLKPIDRYFKKDGAGTLVPIHINGTRESPQFGVDFNRMKKTSPERPDRVR